MSIHKNKFSKAVALGKIFQLKVLTNKEVWVIINKKEGTQFGLVPSFPH